MWAPAVIHANDKYYIFFGANDIQSNNELGGIGVAVADNPAGPFKDVLGKPLIDKFVNGAQPIDQFVYKDDDGQYYMYYGCRLYTSIVFILADDLGYGDISAFNPESKIHTPNIDKLAEHGIGYRQPLLQVLFL